MRFAFFFFSWSKLRDASHTSWISFTTFFLSPLYISSSCIYSCIHTLAFFFFAQNVWVLLLSSDVKRRRMCTFESACACAFKLQCAFFSFFVWSVAFFFFNPVLFFFFLNLYGQLLIIAHSKGALLSTRRQISCVLALLYMLDNCREEQ